MPITRRFDSEQLERVRTAFAAGSPDPDMLADPEFMFDMATHAATAECLCRLRPGDPFAWPDVLWDCLGACCGVGADSIEGLYDEQYDQLVATVVAPSDTGPIGFH